MLCDVCKAKLKRIVAPTMALAIGAIFFSVPPLLDSQTTSPLTVQPSTSRVGVNTPSPTEALDVAGNVKATNFIGNGSQLTSLPAASQWTTSAGNIYYNTGNVGVGTTAPGQKLDVAGDIKTSGAFRVGALKGESVTIPTPPPACEQTGVTSFTVTGGIVTSYTTATGGNCP